MSHNKAPKFSRVELLLKNEGISNNNGLHSTTKIDFLECGLMITGDYLIVTMDEIGGSTTARVFNLKELSAYKTHI
jgi:hypothetical protein